METSKLALWRDCRRRRPVVRAEAGSLRFLSWVEKSEIARQAAEAAEAAERKKARARRRRACRRAPGAFPPIMSPPSRPPSPPAATGSPISPTRARASAWAAEGRWLQQTSHQPALTRLGLEFAMHRKFKITVDGHAYDVVVEEIVSDGGAPAGGSVSWPASVAAASAAVAAAPAHAPVARAAAGAGDEVAPLAGTVQSIDVTVGQMVQAGDKIADHRGDEDEDRGPRQGRRQGRRPSRSSRANPSTPAPSCSPSPEELSAMTMPDSLYGAVMLSLIDFFASMVMISGIGVVLALFPLLNRHRQGRRRRALRKSQH